MKASLASGDKNAARGRKKDAADSAYEECTRDNDDRQAVALTSPANQKDMLQKQPTILKASLFYLREFMRDAKRSKKSMYRENI
jgi:hypothetical protein